MLDREGDPLLTSNAYSSSRTRDNGIETVITNLDNQEKKSDKGEHYFIVKARSHHELARSVPFDSVQEMEKAIDYLQTEFAETEAQGPAPVSSAAPAKTGKESSLPPKYFFRLEYYLSEGRRLRGKIEYPFGEKKTSLEGLDIGKVENFLRKHLPLSAQEESTGTTAAAAAGQQTPAAGARRSRQPAGAATAVATGPNQVYIPDFFDIVNVKTEKKNQLVYRKKDELEILINLDKYDFSQAVYTRLSASIYAIPRERKDKILINLRKEEIPAGSDLSIPFYLGNLPATGIFKILLEAELLPAAEFAEPLLLSSSRLIQVN